MAKFIIEASFWNLFPDAEIAVILAKDINNTETAVAHVRPEITELLKQSNKEAKKFLKEAVFSENSVIAVWREAYRKFKTKKGARCSIEALLKRIEKGNEVGCINPLVDIYNAVSLKYGIPCGGEDLDQFKGDLRLAITEGDDDFLPLGSESNDNTLPQELCYRDDLGAVCRCWNWRDGQRTMLTEHTKNAFLIIESVDPGRREDVKAALVMMAQWTEKCLGGSMESFVLNKTNKEIPL